jgi:hypothetical protein
MFNHPENNTQVQQNCRKNESARHLRIVYPQGTAGRAMKSLGQNRWRTYLQKFGGIAEMIFSDLHPVRYLRGTQKKEIPEKFIIVGSRLKPVVAQIIFKDLAGVVIVKHRHVVPCMIAPRTTHGKPFAHLMKIVKFSFVKYVSPSTWTEK